MDKFDKTEVQSWSEIKNNMLSFLNEGDMIHRNATEETWPALRDAFLIRHDLLDELGDIEFKPRKDDDPTPPKPTLVS